MSSTQGCAGKRGTLLRNKRGIPQEDDGAELIRKPLQQLKGQQVLLRSPPVKKRRRESKPPAAKTKLSCIQTQAESQEHSMGWFAVLPVELLQMVFRLLDVKSLGMLSLTSKNISSAILAYLQCFGGLSHFMPIVFTSHRFSTDPLRFSEVGESAHTPP